MVLKYTKKHFYTLHLENKFILEFFLFQKYFHSNMNQLPILNVIQSYKKNDRIYEILSHT